MFDDAPHSRTEIGQVAKVETETRTLRETSIEDMAPCSVHPTGHPRFNTARRFLGPSRECCSSNFASDRVRWAAVLRTAAAGPAPASAGAAAAGATTAATASAAVAPAAAAAAGRPSLESELLCYAFVGKALVIVDGEGRPQGRRWGRLAVLSASQSSDLDEDPRHQQPLLQRSPTRGVGVVGRSTSARLALLYMKTLGAST